MIGAADARAQGEALARAAEESVVRQVRVELRRRAQEWARAVAMLDGAGDEYAIELVGAVAPGDRVLTLVATPWDEASEEACPVVRVIHRDGQSSLHLAPGSTGRDLYLNYAGPSSPVVVEA